MGTKGNLTSSYKDKDHLKGFHTVFTPNSLDPIFQVNSISYKPEVLVSSIFPPLLGLWLIFKQSEKPLHFPP